jgi:hypothetical protein
VVGQVVHAAPITFPWTVTVSSGPFAGAIGSGSFSYDDSALNIDGDGILDPADGLTLELTLFGQTFFETNDIDYNAYPILTVESFVPTFMNYIVNELNPNNPTPIDQPGVISIGAVSELVPNSSGGFDQDIFLTVIPEPSSLALAFGAIALLLFGRRSGR